MAATNHLYYEKRLTFIKTLLPEEYGIEPTEITPILYDADCPFDFNNFIYKVTFSFTKQAEDLPRRVQPGIQPLPYGATTLIVRLANNLAVGVHSHNRVENEVASINVVRAALAPVNLAHLIPAIYGWGSAAHDQQGWTVMQYMPGEMVEDIEALSSAEQHSIVSQIARIATAIQQYPLPSTVTGFGGLTYNANGEIVSGHVTLNPLLPPAGPYASYASFLSDSLALELGHADTNPVIEGWRANGVRARLDSLHETVIPRIAAPFEVPKSKRTLVSADFTAANMLFAREGEGEGASIIATALLDFDFAFVGTAADEYLRSFRGTGGLVPSPYSADPASAALRDASLAGFPSSSGNEEYKQANDWKLAVAWNQEIQKAGGLRACEIEGLEELSRLNWLITQINPFRLSMAWPRSRLSEAQKGEERAKAEAKIVRALEGFGV